MTIIAITIALLATLTLVAGAFLRARAPETPIPPIILPALWPIGSDGEARNFMQLLTLDAASRLHYARDVDSKLAQK
jgi:hypothetical protein